VNELLKKAVVDIAFICSGAYVSALPENYMEIIAVPVINNKAYYQAYIIVHKDSPYQQFIDLKYKRSVRPYLPMPTIILFRRLPENW